LTIPSPGGIDDRRIPWLRLLFYSAVALTASLRLAMNEADPDLWGHVHYGRELLRDARVPETTTWSFTTVDHPWVNHEIFAELALAWVDHGGRHGSLLLKFASFLRVRTDALEHGTPTSVAVAGGVVLGVVAVNVDSLALSTAGVRLWRPSP
jgi:hypothetical protein